MPKLNDFRAGDTIVEVIFAITVFCMIAVIGMSLMNQGITTAQISLEVSLAREEINAQAEALRFIHNNYIAEMGRQESLPEDSVHQQYTQLWKRVIEKSSTSAPALATTDPTCPNVGKDGLQGISKESFFVLNVRDIGPSNPTDTEFINRSLVSDENRLVVASVFPRILYNTSADPNTSDSNKVDDVNATSLIKAEGIWVLAVRGTNFYDFHVRACWSAPGRSVATTIGTIVRLYDPESL